MAAWWETVLSVGAGGGFVLGGQWLQAHFASAREREARDADRDQKLTDEQRAYELKLMDELRVTLNIVNDSHRHAMRLRRQRREAVTPTAYGVREMLEGKAEPVDEALAAEFLPAIQRLRGTALVVLDYRVREGCLQVADNLPTFSDPGARQAHIDEAYHRIGMRTLALYNAFPDLEEEPDA
ncbi:hypothetical protein IGS73_09410 [Janibacter indicus]|uniref:Uncharacterized protein n=1 Tax=Janibacter indicus TaxID=857417 RepID=A0A7L9IVS1_9MICO|nr:hypothetical protein [Janibacter indicus]QOK21398.1 hypothetical protein IGS73_09410 [Janibacter indicus]